MLAMMWSTGHSSTLLVGYRRTIYIYIYIILETLDKYNLYITYKAAIRVPGVCPRETLAHWHGTTHAQEHSRHFHKKNNKGNSSKNAIYISMNKFQN